MCGSYHAPELVETQHGRRSKIVDGSRIDAATLYPQRVAASKLAVDPLRRISAEWPDVIRAGSRHDRRLILQTAG